MLLDFRVNTVPFEVVVAQQTLIEQIYGAQSQAQSMIQQQQNPPVSQQPAGGEQ